MHNKAVYTMNKKYTYKTHLPKVNLPELESGKKKGVVFSREQLEILASGKISRVFGHFFEKQDHYERQVRMPTPPFLLADRVMALEGEPGSLSKGSITTETDVKEEAWYLHDRHMPTGIMIESGQADLLLASWLGIDFINQDKRVYRLLGCELCFHGPLAEVGDTLRYEIYVDHFTQCGDVSLMFFHYDCYVKDVLRVSVREGQAGFFNEQELRESKGVLWSPDQSEFSKTPRLDTPPCVSVYRNFNYRQIMAFAERKAYACFGRGFEYAATHQMSPTIQNNQLLLLHDIPCFDPAGGPLKRGYLRAIQHISKNDWFFKGHFKNDPCMPGTLMIEIGIQALSFYLAALGFTLNKDGWRFEPIKDYKILVRCRGQCLPSSQEVTYEIFVDEIIAEPKPTIFANLLVTVDGVRAFHARRFGLELVPDVPLTRRMHLLVNDPHSAADDGKNFIFDQNAMLSATWGNVNKAFGSYMDTVSPTRKIPRLPGPPYFFMSRVTHLTETIGSMKVGSKLIAEYDVPPEAWYFNDHDTRTMPLCVLMEVGLQPCGWLSTYVGCSTQTDKDIYFRNLDGNATEHQIITPSTKKLVTQVELKNISMLGELILLNFNVVVLANEKKVLTMETSFGYFTLNDFLKKIGLKPTEEELKYYQEIGNQYIELSNESDKFFKNSLRLPRKKILMFDRVTGIWKNLNKASLCYLRAVKIIDPNEWFFKSHFYQDPVQPGSLGCQALINLLKFYCIEENIAKDIQRPIFEPLMLEKILIWTYRGQVIPINNQVTILVEVLSVQSSLNSIEITARGSFWVDGLCIYRLERIGLRIVPEI